MGLSRNGQPRVERGTEVIPLAQAIGRNAVILERLPGWRAWIRNTGRRKGAVAGPVRPICDLKR